MTTRPIRPWSRITAAACTAVLGTAVLAAAPGAAAAPAQPLPTPRTTAPVSVVGRIEDQTARSLALALADPALRAQVRHAALASRDIDLQRTTAKVDTDGAKRLTTQLKAADRDIVLAKGLNPTVGSLLRVRLGAPTMRTALTAGADPWVLSAGSSDQAGTLLAYDSQGRAHTVTARRAPTSPIYVVDLDEVKAIRAGLAVLHQVFAQRGLNSPSSPNQFRVAGGWWATKIDSVWLADDQEPWYKGDAETYCLVTGFGRDGKVRVDSVDMPWLNNDHTTYYPNQILVNWSQYKYDLTDVVMMEGDSDTNYETIAQAIADALLAITDQGTYIPLVNAVLNALPTSWWTDDDDYVESWYSLASNSKGRLSGASGNGWMTVEPYFVKQF
ncbi:DUF3103 family protein [Streptomyces sp. NPDC047028]|uniref:DUF3103 family protein n=1 Tax=Streptomyces sp. NPDC047028 TaxID=3155793 RepID=UPI0033D37D9A